jgi:F420-0:gamma-glutamyl ligase
MNVRAVKTDIFHVGMDLEDFIIKTLTDSSLCEKTILAVTSKIVSLAENRLVSKDVEKRALVEREADIYFGEIGYGCHLTIKHGLLIPSAGIDESNSESGNYILFPTDPFASLQRLHQRLCAHFKIQDLGIIMTDSHTTPLRRGVTGIALAYWGMRGTRDFVGHPDLFGRKLQMTHVNVVDALATAAVFVMGEADECCPLAIIDGVEADFTDSTDPREVQISLDADLYGPILKKGIAASSKSSY